jgi:5'(3')-deoxyribonucleotidase
MKVALDVDGVIADFYSSVCEKYGRVKNHLHSWDIDWVNENIDEINRDFNLWCNLKVLNDPSKLTFEFDYYVTHIHPDLLEIRVNWLLSNGFPQLPVVVSGDKLTTCRNLGVKVLVDDKPSTLAQFKSADDVIGIQYHSPYASFGDHGDFSVTCLTQINDILKRL